MVQYLYFCIGRLQFWVTLRTVQQASAEIHLFGQVGMCGRRNVFLGFASASLLYSISFADVLNEVTGEGYQRKFSRQHSQDFARYIKQQGSTVKFGHGLSTEVKGRKTHTRIIFAALQYSKWRETAVSSHSVPACGRSGPRE